MGVHASTVIDVNRVVRVVREQDHAIRSFCGGNVSTGGGIQSPVAQLCGCGARNGYNLLRCICVVGKREFLWVKFQSCAQAVDLRVDMEGQGSCAKNSFPICRRDLLRFARNANPNHFVSHRFEAVVVDDSATQLHPAVTGELVSSAIIVQLNHQSDRFGIGLRNRDRVFVEHQPVGFGVGNDKLAVQPYSSAVVHPEKQLASHIGSLDFAIGVTNGVVGDAVLVLVLGIAIGKIPGKVSEIDHAKSIRFPLFPLSFLAIWESDRLANTKIAKNRCRILRFVATLDRSKHEPICHEARLESVERWRGRVALAWGTVRTLSLRGFRVGVCCFLAECHRRATSECAHNEHQIFPR